MSKSLLLLVDGYNVIGPVAAPGRKRSSATVGGGSADTMWLHRERMLLLDRLAGGLSEPVRKRTCVVFDAANPPPDRPALFHYADIRVRFAVDYPEADDLIEELIGSHHSAKQLTVVSSDRRVQTAADRRGATWFDSDPWFDELLDGNVQLAHWPKTRKQTTSAQDVAGGPTSWDDGRGGKLAADSLDAEAIRKWLDEFGFEAEGGPAEH